LAQPAKRLTAIPSAEVSLPGTPDPVTGMVVDLGLLQRAIEDVRPAPSTVRRADGG
jgi:hypothetical protein